MNGSDLLNAGRFAEAVAALSFELQNEKDEFKTFELALANLCAGSLQECFNCITPLINNHKPKYEHLYVYSGVSLWLMKQYRDAVDLWIKGEECGYRDPSGGVGIALLQYFAGVTLQDNTCIQHAMKLLRIRLKAAWAQHWPGPLGRFVVGELTEEQIRIEATRPELNDILAQEQLTQLDFYAGVQCLAVGDRPHYRQHLRRCRLPFETKFTPESFLAPFEAKRRK